MVTTEAVVTKATSAGAPLICWGRHRTYLDARLALIVEALANDQPLEPRHHDHALSGEWGDPPRICAQKVRGEHPHTRPVYTSVRFPTIPCASQVVLHIGDRD